MSSMVDPSLWEGKVRYWVETSNKHLAFPTRVLWEQRLALQG